METKTLITVAIVGLVGYMIYEDFASQPSYSGPPQTLFGGTGIPEAAADLTFIAGASIILRLGWLLLL